MSVHDVTDLFGDVCKPKVEGILKARFLLPPFSVLSARDGDWQQRKRMWLSLGIQSELGRGDVPKTTGGGSVMPAPDYGTTNARGFGGGLRHDDGE